MLLLWIASSAAAFYWLFLGHFGVFDEEGLWQHKPLQPVQVQAQFSQLLRPESAWQMVLMVKSKLAFSKATTLLKPNKPCLAAT